VRRSGRAWQNTCPAHLAEGRAAFATADPVIVTQMQRVGVDLPAHDALDPGRVTEFIAHGIERDVPVLRASGERRD